MSIMRDMMESLDKLSVAQIQQGLQQGRYPAYLAIPAIELKTRMQKQFEQQQAMQQQPPQSTIAEQIMQEAQGVDQLPSNLPEEYAGGGIVAFEDGGEVERYQMGGELGMSSLGGYEPPKPRRWNPFTNSYEPLTPEQEAQLAAGEAELKQTYGATPTAPVPSAPMAGRQDMMDANRAMTGARPPAAGPGAGAAPAGIAGLGVGPSVGGMFPKKPSLGSEAEEAEKRLDALQQQQTQRRAEYEGKRKEVEGKVPGKVLEEYEKEIREAAMKAGASKKEAQSIALVEAGLAMMSGTSSNALENIGKGALVGVGSYKSALKDIEKAQKEHRQALASIEQARRAEAIGDRDRELAYMEKAYNAETESERARIDAIMKARGVDRATALKIYEIEFGGAKTIEGANIQARATMSAARARQREGGISPYQQQMLLFRARQEYPLDMAREELAQRKGMKAPPVGKNTAFDDEARRLHNARLAEIAGIPMPGTQQAAGPIDYKAAGYSVVR